MSEETRIMVGMTELVEPPMKPFLNPFPAKGLIYEYKFIKDVSMGKTTRVSLCPNYRI